MHTQPATDSSSLSQTTLPGRMSSTVSFEAMGISNPPCWSVSLADNAGSTKLVQVSRAPTAEGLPLPSDLPVRKSFCLLSTLQFCYRTSEKSWCHNTGASQGCAGVSLRACCCPEAYAFNKSELLTSFPHICLIQDVDTV